MPDNVMRLLPWIPVVLSIPALFFMRLTRLRRRVGAHLFWKTAASVLFVLCAVLSQLAGGIAPAAFWWMLAGFLLSLVGDVLLDIPRDNLFIPGAGSFGLAHVCYATAMVLRFGFSPWCLAVAGVLIAGCIAFFSLSRRVDIRAERPVVYGYSAIIACMAGAASLGIINHGFTPGAVLCGLGAVLFMVSDFVLALGRYAVRPMDVSTVNLSTYYSAQLLLALSLLFAV